MSHDEEATVVMFAYQVQDHCLRSVNGFKSNLGFCTIAQSLTMPRHLFASTL